MPRHKSRHKGKKRQGTSSLVPNPAIFFSKNKVRGEAAPTDRRSLITDH
jgi:hypothetical protein